MSFVERDLGIIQQAHEVLPQQWSGMRDLWKLYRGISETDIVFCWFGKLHAYWAVRFARLLGKKSIVVAGGDDVVHVPEIKYGMYSYWWKRWCPNYVFRNTDVILCVSEFNRIETIENTGAALEKIITLVHGFDSEKWQPVADIPKEPIVLTVGRVTRETLPRKGLELFVRAARLMPDTPFFVVGPCTDGSIQKLRNLASDNVTVTGGLCRDDLIEMYLRAKVYVQASVHEGFGCSVAEAMLCKCVPVVSRRAALPEVVGDVGFYAENMQPESLAAAIDKALQSDMGGAARERVIDEFSIEKRRKNLLKALEELERNV